MKIEGLFLVIFLTMVFVTTITLKILIPILASKKMGQRILEIGPRWHKSKEGTPTMGGVSFVFATVISYLIFLFIAKDEIDRKQLICVLNIVVYALLNAMIGIIDDFAKLRKAKNEGLTPMQKLLFQGISAILLLISLHFSVGISTRLYIPFFDAYLELGAFYYVFCFLLLCGVVNSVNLTDGLDGLASSVVATVGIFFSVIAITVTKDYALAFFGAILLGGALGFLVYNFYPARVFMGDTGSLFFGARVVSISFLLNNPLLVLLYGFIFICEAGSVILQVLYFKLTKGKRLFKMAPLHHHLEKCGLSEIKIVSIFTLINALFCIFAFWGIGHL